MASMRQAINNMCKSCIYDSQSGNGTWRQQTESCTAKSCPLFDLRPKQLKTKHSDTENEEV